MKRTSGEIRREHVRRSGTRWSSTGEKGHLQDREATRRPFPPGPQRKPILLTPCRWTRDLMPTNGIQQSCWESLPWVGSILTAEARLLALQGRAAVTGTAHAEGHLAENAHSLEGPNPANSHVNWNEDLELQVRTRPDSTLCDSNSGLS